MSAQSICRVPDAPKQPTRLRTVAYGCAQATTGALSNEAVGRAHGGGSVVGARIWGGYTRGPHKVRSFRVSCGASVWQRCTTHLSDMMLLSFPYPPNGTAHGVNVAWDQPRSIAAHSIRAIHADVSSGLRKKRLVATMRVGVPCSRLKRTLTCVTRAILPRAHAKRGSWCPAAGLKHGAGTEGVAHKACAREYIVAATSGLRFAPFARARAGGTCQCSSPPAR